MKKLLLILLFMVGGLLSFAQSNQKTVGTATLSIDQVFNRSVIDYQNQPKTIQCIDTIHYSLVKQQQLGPNGNSGFSTFSLWQSDAESVSQMFYGYAGMQVRGVEILGFRSTSSAATVVVRASIYNVDGTNTPTGASLGSGTVTITSTTQNFYSINFATPISVSGNYAVVLDVTNTGGIYTSFYNNATPGQVIDENLTRYKSNDPTLGSNGNWIAMTSITGLGQTVDFEPIVAPIVSYQINTTGTVSPTTACLGTPVTFTNTTTTPQLGNRMYNYSKYRQHFGFTPNDSTYVWDVDNDANPATLPPADLIWSGNMTHTYAASGSFTPEIYSLGGFLASCLDYQTHSVTINPTPATPTVSASGSLALCGTGTVTLTSSAATGNLWSNGATTQAITVSTAGSYTVTVSNGTCTSAASAAQVVTVGTTPATPTITASGSLALCPGGSVTLTSSSAIGNQWSNGATTQSITVSSAGTYTALVSASGCNSPASAPQVVTVNPLDNATFAYSTNSICDGSPNVTPTTSTAGSFSATPAGLNFVSASTGEINVAGSTAGTYSVTYTTSGTCPNSSTQTIVISGTPDATFTYAQASYCADATNASPDFPVGASAGTFSATPAGLSFVSTSTGVINVSGSTAGTYTVTNSIPANGACPANAETFTVTINAVPSATVSGGGTQCGTGSLAVNVALTGAGPWDVTYSDGTSSQTETGITTSPFVINATANGTYTVSTVTMNGCSAAGSGTASVVFNTNPTVTFTQVADVCTNGGVVNLVATPAGGTFSGSTGVSGSTFDPAGMTAGLVTLTYTFTDVNNCSGTATSTFTVNAAPTVTLGTFTDVCSSASSFALSGGLPAGGTYSGTAVTGGNFDPATATVGANTITYTVTENGCTGTAAQTITVEDCAGIAELQNFGLQVFPNPATEVVTIKTGKDVSFSMISEDGRVVYPASSLSIGTETQLNVSHLAKGVYFINFTGAQGNLVQKVILK